MINRFTFDKNFTLNLVKKLEYTYKNYKEKLFVTINAKNIQQFEKTLKNVIKNNLNCIEIRFDFFKNLSIEKDIKKIVTLIEEYKIKRVIFTIKKFSFDFNERKLLVDFAFENNINFIDIEYNDDELIKYSLSKKKLVEQDIDKNNLKNNINITKILISYHNYSKTPSYKEILNIIETIDSFSPDLIKIATYVNNEKGYKTLETILHKFSLFYNTKQSKLNNILADRLIVLPMGDDVSLLRFDSFILSPFTYIVLKEKEKATKGQLTVDKIFDFINNIFKIDKL